MHVLRPYQEKAVQSFFDYWNVADGNPLVTAPVGAGKSLILAEFIKRACDLYPGTRIIVLSHVKELLVQDAEELVCQWPHAPFGFYSAGLGRRDTHAQIIFAGIQSIHNKANTIGIVDLVLVDEAHLVSPTQSTMYRKFFQDLLKINPKLKVAGVTGTPFRAVSGYLTEGKNAIFTDIVFEIPILYLIEEGYLSPVITPDVSTVMDTSGVGKIAGDFIPGQLEKAVDKKDITISCVNEIVQHGADRKMWLIFCAGVSHAEHTCEEIKSRGISCEYITGKTPKAERDKIITDYKAGKIRCLVNVAVLTTGFNAPGIDLLAFMRPTRSPVLYVQCCGRGMRTAQGKTDCLVLDFGGVVKALGPIDSLTVPKPSNGNGDAPLKQCPECLSINHAAVRVCFDCGYEWPEPDPKVEAKSSRAAILSSQIESVWHDVRDVTYRIQKKKGKPDSIKVSYITGLVPVCEWVCPEHKGYAHVFFYKWWISSTQTAVPKTTNEALERIGERPKPSRILVRPAGKYQDILEYDFA